MLAKLNFLKRRRQIYQEEAAFLVPKSDDQAFYNDQVRLAKDSVKLYEKEITFLEKELKGGKNEKEESKKTY